MSVDSTFDEVYPEKIRKVSSVHWTPVSVAEAAAKFLCDKQNMRVLDVGSGVGKFCLVAAGCEPSCEFVGIEQRAYLVQIAKKAATRLNISNVQFQHGTLASIEWNAFDAFYFYNPYYEQLAHENFQIDFRVSTSEVKFKEYVEDTQENLAKLAKGTRIATFGGFGGEMPSNYEMVSFERMYRTRLEFWEKKRK